MLHSFSCAIKGIVKTLKTERNIRVMLAALVLVVAAGLLFGISGSEWTAVLICSGGVLSLEMVNTAIESVTDLVTTQRHPLAARAKDIAAGAVLVFSLTAFIVALIIFIPHIIRLFGSL